MARGLVICLAALASTAAASDCNTATLDFVLLDGNAQHAAFADDIIADLAKVGITAVPRYLAKDGDDGFNAAMVNGDFDIVFSEVRARERGGAGGKEDRPRASAGARTQTDACHRLRIPRPGARRTTRTATCRRGPRRTRRTTR